MFAAVYTETRVQMSNYFQMVISVQFGRMDVILDCLDHKQDIWFNSGLGQKVQS